MVGQWPSGVVLVMALVLAGCTVGPSRSTAGQPPTATLRLAYVAEDDHVYTIPLEGGDPRRVDALPGEPPVAGEIRASRWPTWAPNGARLAFVRLRSGEGDEPATAAVWTVSPDGTDLRKIWESQDLAPIYLSWSPDASTLSLLAQGGDTLTLLLIDPTGGRSPRNVAQGSPLYSSWSPDGSELVLHVSGDHRSNPNAELTVLRPGPTDERRPLGLVPGDFRAPAWSPDGTRLAVIAEAPDRSGVLTIASSQGGETVRLAPIGDEGAFVWAPNGDRLAFSSRSPTERLFYQGLEVIKGDGSGRTQITQEPVMAFFWAPDSEKLAFAALDRQAGALAWFVTDGAGKNRKQIGTFLPSREQLQLFGFFDQYAQSHALWSPDSRYLIYAGVPPGSRGDPSASRRGQVYVAPADGSAEPKVVVDGNLAVWPAGRQR